MLLFHTFLKRKVPFIYLCNLFICPGLNNEEYQVVIGNDTTRYIIDDLEPARNYTFYVVAYMPMGASRMSDHVFQHTFEDGEAKHCLL